MRLVNVLIFLVTLSLTTQSSPQQASAKLTPQTRENLMKAMHGEAFAYAKYMAYAEQARTNGHTAIADLFEQTAKVEHLEHFNEMAQLVQLADTDAANLRDAIQGESQESQTMYPQFAEQAAAAGDEAAAERFRELAKDETKHRSMFHAALDSLENKNPAGKDHPTER